MPAMLLFPAQENAYHKEDSMVSQVVFNLGMPVPLTSSNKVIKSSAMTPAPKSASELSDPETSKLSPPPSSQSPVHLSVNNSNNTATNFVPSAVNSNNVACLKDVDISDSQVKPEEDVSDEDDVFKTEKKDNSEEESDVIGKAETLAESSLPWRRQTNLPSVPSSITSSLPDDENPLMSEAPSWADNLAYSHLTETGSPYCSPQNTITSKPAVATHRPVFELFSSNSPQLSDIIISSIPPPWSCKDNSADSHEDEPLPSYSVAGSNAGDKASCLLMSCHDRAPPSYHSCLQQSINGLDASTSRRHSDVGSPIHFQLMQKPEIASASAIESHLIGIEEDYYHGMADRVSQWLAHSGNDDAILSDVKCELAGKEERQRILESLNHKKKWIMEDTDDGTDADVESDNEMHDTRL